MRKSLTVSPGALSPPMVSGAAAAVKEPASPVYWKAASHETAR